MSSLGSLGRRVAVFAVLVAMLGIALELGANLFYLAAFGGLYYSRQPEVAAASEVPDMFQTRQAVLHPYFGFVNNAERSDPWEGDTAASNNHGFQFAGAKLAADPGCCDVPHARRDDEVVVGVFGGSVGVGFALWSQLRPVFSEALQRDPRFAGRKINVLTFALSGFRQPQQLEVLAYYLAHGQPFDVVINIDGFNEVVNSQINWNNRLEPTYPADSVWGAMGRALEQGQIAQNAPDALLASWHQLAAGEARKAKQSCSLALCYAWHHGVSLYHAIRQASLQRNAAQAAEKQTWFPASHRYTFETPDFDLFAYVADRWRDSSILMHRMLADTGTQYLHVLQPNQWYREAAGPYTPIAPDHIYGWVIQPVNDAYPKFQARIAELRKAGVPFFDATKVFPDSGREIYADDCCHYTEKGNALLAEAVAQAIIDGAPK
jgi:hypothetical protein